MCDTALVEELGPKQASGDGFKEQHPPQPHDSSGSPRKSVSLFLWVGQSGKQAVCVQQIHSHHKAGAWRGLEGGANTTKRESEKKGFW